MRLACIRTSRVDIPESNEYDELGHRGRETQSRHGPTLIGSRRLFFVFFIIFFARGETTCIAVDPTDTPPYLNDTRRMTRRRTCAIISTAVLFLFVCLVFFVEELNHNWMFSFFCDDIAYGNLAAILAREQRQTEAEHAYRQALAHRPNMAETHFNL